MNQEHPCRLCLLAYREDLEDYLECLARQTFRRDLARLPREELPWLGVNA